MRANKQYTYLGNIMTDNEIFQCKAITIPTGRKYKNTQFSTIKRRSGGIC